MGWNFDDFNISPAYEEPEQKTSRFGGFLVGAIIGAITLALITALVLTTVGYFFLPETQDTRRFRITSHPRPTCTMRITGPATGASQ